MKNALIFFYNIYVSEINKINNDYYFLYQNNDYVVSLYDRSINELNEIYSLNIEMIKYNIPVYKILLTKDNHALMNFENKYYILMQIPRIKNRIVTFDDILMFNVIPQKKYKTIDKSSWNISWSNKIDYIENQFYQLQNKYPLIKESINYYIGIWENGISYYNGNYYQSNASQKLVSHKRIGVDTDLLSFYNPLNIVIDYKERDIVDYLKSYIYGSNWTKDNLYSFLDKTKNLNLTRIVARSLFPSKYFDLYEDVILGNLPEEKLLNVINKNNIYERFIVYIFDYFKKYNIPIIDWVIKKD